MWCYLIKCPEKTGVIQQWVLFTDVYCSWLKWLAALSGVHCRPERWMNE